MLKTNGIEPHVKPLIIASGYYYTMVFLERSVNENLGSIPKSSLTYYELFYQKDMGILNLGLIISQMNLKKPNRLNEA